MSDEIQMPPQKLETVSLTSPREQALIALLGEVVEGLECFPDMHDGRVSLEDLRQAADNWHWEIGKILENKINNSRWIDEAGEISEESWNALGNYTQETKE